MLHQQLVPVVLLVRATVLPLLLVNNNNGLNKAMALLLPLRKLHMVYQVVPLLKLHTVFQVLLLANQLVQLSHKSAQTL